MPHPHATNNHSHRPSGSNVRLLVAVALLFSFAAIEISFGWFANSLALISDATHVATDGVSLLLAAIAAWVAKKGPSSKHSYGWGRAEVLGAWLSSLFMVIIAIFIAIEAISRLSHPHTVTGSIVMIVAAIGAFLNLALMKILSHAEQSLNLRAALLHVLGDLLGSLAALMSGTVIYFTSWMPIDAMLSLFIAALILLSSLNLLRETVLVLMEGVPLHLNLSAVGKSMAQVDKVKAVHDLHIWTLSSGMIVLTAHIELVDLNDWDIVYGQLQELLASQFDINHITLQPGKYQQAVVCRSEKM